MSTSYRSAIVKKRQREKPRLHPFIWFHLEVRSANRVHHFWLVFFVPSVISAATRWKASRLRTFANCWRREGFQTQSYVVLKVSWSISASKIYVANMSWRILENDMDGDAIVLGLASCPGPDWLKDIVPKAGHRFRVHRLLSSMCTGGELQVSVLNECSCHVIAWLCHILPTIFLKVWYSRV